MTRGRDFDRRRRQKMVRDQGTTAARTADAPYQFSRPRLRTGYGDVMAAARWLIENRQRLRDEQRHPVPELQREFGLTAKQACEAIRHANASECTGE